MIKLPKKRQRNQCFWQKLSNQDVYAELLTVQMLITTYYYGVKSPVNMFFLRDDFTIFVRHFH